MGICHRQGGAGQSGQHPAENQTLVTQTADTDPHGIDRLRRHADCADAEAPGGTKQYEPEKWHQQERKVNDKMMVEKHRPDDWNVAQSGDFPCLESGNRLDTVHIQPKEQSGQAPAQHRQPDAADSLFRLQGHADKSHQQTHQATGDDSRQQAEQRRLADIRDVETGKRAHQHDAFQAQVEHAGPLAEHLTERRQQIGGRQPDACGDHPDQNSLFQAFRHIRTPPRSAGSTCSSTGRATPADG